MLFMGILSTRGFPDILRERLEEAFGPIRRIYPAIPFTFTDYYDDEMGKGIERFFISFARLASPDSLAEAKIATNRL